MRFFSHSHVLLVFFFCSTGYVYSITSLTLSDSSTKLLGNQLSQYESYPIFLVCIKRCAIASHNLLSHYLETDIKSLRPHSAKGIFGKPDSFIILIKTVRIRRKTMLVQARPVFFFSEREYKTKQKKIRNFSIVRLVSKNITPSSCRAFD